MNFSKEQKPPSKSEVDFVVKDVKLAYAAEVKMVNENMNIYGQPVS